MTPIVTLRRSLCHQAAIGEAAENDLYVVTGWSLTVLPQREKIGAKIDLLVVQSELPSYGVSV